MIFMENFKNEVSLFLQRLSSGDTTKRRIFSLFTACGLIVVCGWFLSLLWNTLALILPLNMWPVYTTIKDFASFLGLFLTYELINNNIKN